MSSDSAGGLAASTVRPPQAGEVTAPGEDASTKASLLADRIREAILSGELGPGTKINLARLRESLGVSLSPLREALARLIAVGLVEFHDNRGYRVAPVSGADLAEITRLRAEFESLALAEAIAHADVAWEGEVIRALHRLNRIERRAEEPETLVAWEAAHRDFHLALLSGCRLTHLLHFCGVLHNLNDRYRRVFLAQSGGDRNVAQEHSEIAQGAVARDAPYACARLRDHILRTGTNLQARLEGHLAP